MKGRVGDAPAYLSLDIDAVDAASAPGTGSPVPGGPTTGEVRRFLKGLEGIELVAADLVEVNPLYDPTQVTAIAASSFRAAEAPSSFPSPSSSQSRASTSSTSTT